MSIDLDIDNKDKENIKYIKACRRRAAFEKVKYTMFWAIPLAVFLVLGSMITYMIAVKMSWNKFLVEFAKDMVYTNAYDSMKATHDGEKVRVSFDNRVLLYDMIKTAGPDGKVFLEDSSDTIYIEFGNGHTMQIIKVYGERCFIRYRGDKNYNFKIGVQGVFGHFITITSKEGGNYPNSPWEEAE